MRFALRMKRSCFFLWLGLMSSFFLTACCTLDCPNGVEATDFGPAYVGESVVTEYPDHRLVTTQIVLDRYHAEVHIALPANADTSTFTFTATGRRILSIEELRPEVPNHESTYPIMVVHFDADAIPNTEKARAHMYPQTEQSQKEQASLSEEDLARAQPVMNMVNLSATYSYCIPH